MSGTTTLLATRRVFNSSTGELFAPGDAVTLPTALLTKGQKAKTEVADKGGLAPMTTEAVDEVQRRASSPVVPKATVAGTPGGPVAAEPTRADTNPADAAVEVGGAKRRKTTAEKKAEQEAQKATDPAAEPADATQTPSGDAASILS